MDPQKQNSRHELPTHERRELTVYHCCVHKSASQWFAQLFQDPVIERETRLAHFNPKTNFVPGTPELLEGLSFPEGTIVSPLYVRYEDFAAMAKPASYRAFYVARDPRDLVVSDYFSLRYSHLTSDPYIAEMRAKLGSLSLHAGLQDRINASEASYFSVLREWAQAEDTSAIRIFKFEDLFGDRSVDHFRELFRHCRMDLPDPALERLLEQYSFEAFSGGRKPGEEDAQSHYRKGIAGDWRNYFSDREKDLFKQRTGSLLVELGYERNEAW